ncbi:microfibril-associated glycoprotein 4-like [Hemibagrus wyckioides]|uniref:microfibril-associated glycoprotein 4-like n=1 Tax=Hemibagrus wyckioides TaxID=337641 RepID=UPI00266C760F|nr:microfibril-associated glycoprotein 4-like [Hemibagrus wyckioides]
MDTHPFVALPLSCTLLPSTPLPATGIGQHRELGPGLRSKHDFHILEVSGGRTHEHHCIWCPYDQDGGACTTRGPYSLPDCHEIYRSGVQRNGIYTIYPSVSTPVNVYCDMGCSEDSSQGWTVIQSRMDGSVNFYRCWDQYKNGFGNESGEYWLGLENLYTMTHNKLYELKVDLEDHDGVKAFALYTVFFVSSEENGYMLTGTCDSLSYHSGQKLSTYDNEQNSYGCAQHYLVATCIGASRRIELAPEQKHSALKGGNG